MSLGDESLGRRSLRDLLHLALDQPPEQRRAFIEAQLPRGTELGEALALLDRIDHVDGFLERPHTTAPGTFRSAIPARIGPYVIERLLGYGSMGVVYLAQQSAPARKVALKLLRLDQSSSAAGDRFRRESEALARLSHPGIARVYEAGVADLGAGQQPWFAMEYVDGVSLTVHAEAERLDRRERVALIVDVARAVQHAHAEGIVHRDLKPENVLVVADRGPGSSRIRVLDFGVARMATESDHWVSLTATGQVVGTLAYMAPEQARSGVVDARADQFALGAMLYELLTGELPLAVRGKLMHDALRTVADCDWTPVSQRDRTLAGDLEAILGTALAPEANRRYASVAAFADDLERWLAGRAIRARRHGVGEAVARMTRRHPMATVAIAVGIGIGGAAAALLVDARLDEAHVRGVVAWLSDRGLLDDLEARADALWPADSTTEAELRTWLDEATALAGRTPQHRAALARSVDPSGISRALVPEGHAFVARVDRFLAPGGPMETLRRRHELAATLFTRTVTEHAEGWAAARARVARDRRFEGFELQASEGLVPLGPDPMSGLEEFAAYTTGRVPERSSVSRAVVPRAGDALTFVLIPGGTYMIGAPTTSPASEAPSSVGWVPPHHGPAFNVALDPFLLSKFEMTQTQAIELSGRNPSYNFPGKEFGGVVTTSLHPVECFSWDDSVRLLARHGLALPTEAQWEVAALAGRAHPWVWGPSGADLLGRANVQWGGDSPIAGAAGIPTDGYWEHAPVGSFEPNPFGLHDVLGNVLEHCLDDYEVDYHELPHRAGDGLVIDADPPDGGKSLRGAHFGAAPDNVHVHYRVDRVQDSSDRAIGIRPIWVFRQRIASGDSVSAAESDAE